MVRIDPPPPKRLVKPVFLSLSRGARLLRIYDSGEWNNTPITFRRTGGPVHRFDHHLNPDDDSRGIHYSAKTMEGCLVEVFGDDGLISTGERRLGSALLKRSLKLLDLRGEGAWQAGVNAAICASPLPAEPQQWARYFYKTYSEVDGLVYSNAHNAAVAYALFERADGALNVENDLPLADPRLRLRLLAAAAALNLALID